MRIAEVRQRLGARLPPRVRRVWHRFQREAPLRVRDFIPDLLQPEVAGIAVPPAALRARVERTSSRAAFLESGPRAFQDIVRTFERLRTPDEPYPVWLDFGCGCGRVARYLLGYPEVQALVGVDVDAPAIRWDQRHLPRGRYLLIAPDPPTSLPDAAIDVAYAGSVFTHFDEPAQHAWLGELQRVLRPGGLLIASTHAPALVPSRPDVGAEQLARLERSGFLYAPAHGSFNDNTTFHSHGYLQRTWGQYFQERSFEPYGLVTYQDLSVWERRSRSEGAPT